MNWCGGQHYMYTTFTYFSLMPRVQFCGEWERNLHCAEVMELPFCLNMYQDIVLENENWISDFTQYQFVSKITIWPCQKMLWFVIYLKFRGVWFVVSLKGKECKFNKLAFSVKVCPTKSWQYLQTVLWILSTGCWN